MSEKITPKRVLDTLATRKPCDWTECTVHGVATKGQVKLLQDLPLFYAEDGYNPMDELLVRDSNGLKYKMPQRFLLLLFDGTLCYINTEGYSYCRYALRLGKSDVFPEGLPKTNTPIIQAKVKTEYIEDIKTPIESKISESFPPAHMLVLAAKALTCYLEYKEHPEGCRLLVKMLNEAIKDYENE
jgi:hypothetical protein